MIKLRRKEKEGWENRGLEVLRTNDFETTHLKRNGTYVVCFGATWCRPTRRFVAKFVARKDRLPATLALGDITEWSDPLWDRFRIKITPTIVVFRDGTPMARFDGRRFWGLGDSDLDQLAALLANRGGAGSSLPTAPPPK